MPRRAFYLTLCCGIWMGAAQTHAQQAPSSGFQSPQVAGENGETMKGSTAPATLALTYNSDVNGNVDGGNDHRAAYLQRIGLIGDLDLERVVGWQGASAHVSLHLINGTGTSGRVGTLLPVSGIEAEPAFRLFNLWVEQKLGTGTTLRVGQFTAAQEFAVSATAGLFINSTFGWPANFATDLPSGGPAYPLAAPGVRLAVTPSPKVAIRAAIFAGDPAGPGTGDPQRRDLHGLNGLRFSGRPFLITEISRSAGGSDPAWTLTLGGWLHLDHFADLARDDRGGLLGAPGSSGTPFEHRHDTAVYAMLDARILKAGARTLHGFLRVSASPSDRNPIDRYLDAGLSVSSPLPSRPNDTFGIAIAVARLSPRLRTHIATEAAATGLALPLRRFEAVVEASWRFSVNSNFYLQPNAQLILHPSAALASDPIAAPPSSRAVVLGLRTSLRI